MASLHGAGDSWHGGDRYKRLRSDTESERLVAQVATFHRNGLARTNDHQMLPSSSAQKNLKDIENQNGKGLWKKWTAPAILKAASCSPTQTAISAAPDGITSTSFTPNVHGWP